MCRVTQSQAPSAGPQLTSINGYMLTICRIPDVHSSKGYAGGFGTDPQRFRRHCDRFFSRQSPLQSISTRQNAAPPPPLSAPSSLRQIFVHQPLYRIRLQPIPPPLERFPVALRRQPALECLKINKWGQIPIKRPIRSQKKGDSRRLFCS